MPGTDDAIFPFWSPDSRYIGFFAQGKLKKIAANGGPAQYLCDAPYGQGSWSREGVIVFSRGLSGIQRVSAEGGVPTDVMVRRVQTRFPVFLPDGHHFLYLLDSVSADQNGIYILWMARKTGACWRMTRAYRLHQADCSSSARTL
jgi:hypothetical protein